MAFMNFAKDCFAVINGLCKNHNGINNWNQNKTINIIYYRYFSMIWGVKWLLVKVLQHSSSRCWMYVEPVS